MFPPMPDLLLHERAAWSAGAVLIGIDEVGRGPLAGPVVAGAVCFPLEHLGIDGVRDSNLVKRSSRLHYLRGLSGKASRIAEDRDKER